MYNIINRGGGKSLHEWWSVVLLRIRKFEGLERQRERTKNGVT